MANKVKTLSTGAELNITMASFQDSHRLFKAVMKEIGELGFNAEMNQRLMIKLLSSEAVESALWPCMARAAYNKIKVNQELFDLYEEARSDYIEIAGEVLGFNLNPFLKDLGSSLMNLKEKNTDSQK